MPGKLGTDHFLPPGGTSVPPDGKKWSVPNLPGIAQPTQRYEAFFSAAVVDEQRAQPMAVAESPVLGYALAQVHGVYIVAQNAAGMIEIFGSASPTSGANPAALAHGISVALYNTLFGIGVAIPAVIFYRHFRNRVDTLVIEMESQAIKLIEIIHGERRA